MNAPFKRYNGGKSGNGVYQTIINNIPACTTYVELFLGNGGVLKNLQLPKKVYCLDIDAEVINKWLELQKAGEVPAQILFHKGDGVTVLKNCMGDDRSTFYYCDPPYLMSTRRSQKKLYKHEWITWDHEQFLTAALTSNASVMISHYPCKFYDERLQGWRTIDYKATTSRGVRTERLYMNYPPPVILQDHRYLGNNYRQRELIKRKTQNLLNKIDKMNPVERSAILSALIRNYNDTAVALIK